MRVGWALVGQAATRQQQRGMTSVVQPAVSRETTEAMRREETEKVRRVFAISDVHVDDPRNMAWVENLEARPRDTLIVAGDLSDRPERIEAALAACASKYEQVVYCPGNHELWCGANETSLDKLAQVTKVAENAGASTDARTVGKKGEGRVCAVAPLLSWHHASFDTEPPVSHWKGIPSARLVMTDFKKCRWPHPLRDDDESVARHVDGLNAEVEARVRAMRKNGAVDDVVTFSHFLPRIDLLPEKRYLFLPTLTKAVGSRFLGDTVARIKPDAHVFGHTHIAWDATHDGIRYLQAALAYPNEWETRPASLTIGDLGGGEFGAAENSLDNVVPSVDTPTPETLSNPGRRRENQHPADASGLPRAPLLVWDSVNGLVPRTYSARWSDHYRRYPRVPSLTHVLPPYTARYYKPQPGSEVRPVDQHVRPFSAAERANHSLA